MLVLSRKIGERIQIGDDVTLIVSKIDAGRVKLAFDAPREVSIVRDDVKKADKVDPVKNQEWEAE